MPKGVISAYEAGKTWDISPETVKKWISNKRVKGYSKDFGEGILRYYVYEPEISRISGLLKKNREKGKSLLED